MYVHKKNQLYSNDFLKIWTLYLVLIITQGAKNGKTQRLNKKRIYSYFAGSFGTAHLKYISNVWFY